MSNTAVVERFIASCGTGDLETALGLLDEKVHVSEPAGLPMGGEYDGKAEFVNFLQKVAASYDVKIHTVEVTGAGERVLAFIGATWTAHATGRSLQTRFCELYSVADEAITALDVFPKDTRALYEITVAAS